MKINLTLLACLAVAACAKAPTAPAPAAPAPTATHAPLRIGLASIYVDDQDQALRFYTDVMGFAKKDDVTNGPYRWLTVIAEPDGAALQLAPLDDTAKAYQQALFQQRRPAAMFFTDDVAAQYARLEARGAEFTMPPTDIGFAKIAMLKDTCGNLIQLTQLLR